MQLITACVVGMTAMTMVTAAAQTDDERAAIEVSLVASSDLRPVSGQVILRGPVILASECGADGRTLVDRLPRGRYSIRASAPGYQPSAGTIVDVGPVRRVVTIALAKKRIPRRIGTVATSARVADVDRTGVAAAISADALAATAHTSGIDPPFDSDDPEKPPTISLEGHPSDSIAQTIDGIPLDGPGITSALRFINPDLLAGVGATFGPVPGSSGGAIDFRTLDPTIAWNADMRLRNSTFGASGLHVSERGSLGNLGFVVAHADRVNRGAVDGRNFLDASGDTYTHSSLLHDIGDSVKLRIPLSSAGYTQTLAIGDARTADQTCMTQTAAVPCSYGPGARTHNRFALLSQQTVVTLGSTLLSGSIARIDTTALATETAPGYAATAVPTLSSAERTSMTAISLGADTSIARHHELSLRIRSGSVERSYAQNGASLGDALRYRIGSIADRVGLSSRLQTTLHLSDLGTNYGGDGVAGGTQLAWNSPNAGRFALALDAGAGNPQAPNISVLTDPSLLQFSCAAGAAFGASTGDAPRNASQRSARVGWSTEFRHNTLSLTAYTQSIRNATVPAIYNATTLGGLSPGYLAQATTAYHSPLVCGRSGPTPTIYLSTLVSGARETFTGLRLESTQIEKRVSAHVFIDATRATATGSDARLNSPNNLTAIGTQLLGVPPLRGGADVSYQWPGLRGLLSVTWSGPNNPRNLRTYALVSAGIEKQFPGMVATAYVDNLFQTQSGVLATTALGVPLHAANGSAVPFAGIPFAPREFHLALRFGVGPDRANISSGTNLPLANTSTPPDARVSGFPAQPPAQPFRVAPDAGSCPRESAALDRRIFDPIARAVAILDRDRAANIAPSARTVTTIDGIDVEFIPESTTYALVISTGRIDALRAIAGCNFLHIGNVEDARRYNAYVPSSVSQFRQKILFTPALGLYLVDVPHPEHDDLRVYALTDGRRDGSGFGIRPACPAQVRPTVTAALADVAAYVESPTEKRTSPWHIVKHGAGDRIWYSLANNDTAIVHGIIACAHVSAASPLELAQRGLGAVAQPSLNYAPGIGLYILMVGLGD